MAIWTSEIKDLEKLYESFKGQLPDLEKELERLIKADDENMILLYSRRCLEVIITDLCECELKRPRKTEPLKGIIDKLRKEEKVPSHIITSMHGLNELSTYGAHPKDFDPEQVKPVLNNLDIIIKWYLKYKNIVTIDKTEVEEEKVRLKEEPLEEVKKDVSRIDLEKPVKIPKCKWIFAVAIVTISVITVILAYPKIFKQDILEKLRSSGERISVAVMPFMNMTNDPTLNVWQDGIQNELITSLTNSEELKVRQTESISNLIQSKGFVNYASITPSIASTISQKLDANVFIYGSIKQAGSTIRINAQLIDSKTEEAFKSFEIDGTADNILHTADSLSVMVRNFLVISKYEKEVNPDFQTLASTNSPKAYKFYIYGNDAFFKRDASTAVNMYLQALTSDSNFISAAIMLSVNYFNQGLYEDAKKWCLKVYRKRDQMSIQQNILTNWIYAMNFETPDEMIKCDKQLLKIDDQLPRFHYHLGLCYSLLYQYDKAIPECKKALEIYNKWGVKPMWIFNYTVLGNAYHQTKQYRKEKKLYKKAEHDFPNDEVLIFRQAVLDLSEGKIKDANEYIEKYKSVRKEQAATDAVITTNLASLYWQGQVLDKAEEYYRKALSLEPDNLARMNILGWFLIDTDRNIKEGLEVNDKALELSPDNHYYLDCKGWGLYKQGKYEEALKIIEKSWELRPVYRHEVYLHLEAAKKAVAGQKNN